MVRELERFPRHPGKYADRYVIIGGSTCESSLLA